MKQEKQKRYIFDFYSIASVQQDLFAMTTEAAFEKIINGDHPKSYASYGCIREVFGLNYRSNTNSYAGQIRKIRKADLPEIGALGKDGKKIELEMDEGVIEKNFFVYYKENSLLVIHRNDDGNTGLHLAQLLTASAGVTFFASPIIRPDQAEMLLNKKLSIKKFSVKIPKPTNPDLYPQDN
ncbi:hypothetical protein PS834_04440 [Pseudomonas fluorescens]|nr:hypothetical protein PS834_04440 [Pseudomonas fluorescens]